MDGRTRLAIGGMTAVAASVAVICAVALTNSVALSDAKGSSVEAASVVVKSSAPTSTAPATTSAPAPRSTPAVREAAETAPSEGDSAVAPPASDEHVAEVVPAPAPVVVTPSDDAVDEPSVAKPPAPGPSAKNEKQAIAEAAASGSWTSARQWATRPGWSQERIDAWIAQIEKTRGRLEDWQREKSGDRTQTDADRLTQSDDDRRVASDGKADRTRERSTQADSHKSRSAHADAKTDSRSVKPGVGEKKDRSRDSPDRRDR